MTSDHDDDDEQRHEERGGEDQGGEDQGGDDRGGEERGEHASRDRTPVSERVVGAIGTLVAAALLAFLGWQAIVRESPPELSVVVTDVRETPTGFVTSLEVRNTGGRTAAGAHVAGAVTRDGEPVATAGTTVGYVPPDSRRPAALVFPSDPRAAGTELDVTVTGYTPM